MASNVYYLRWTQGPSLPHSSPILPYLPSTTYSCYPLAEVVDGKMIEDIETKIIAKDGTVTRVPRESQGYETSEEEPVEQPRRHDLYGFVDHPQLYKEIP
ncbi:hypothetical protein Tco_0446201 [Tanacetum coccineum]